MLLMRAAALSLALACLVAPAAAQDAKDETAAKQDAGAKPAKKRGSAEFRVGFYANDDGDGDGNPFLDEESTIIEPVLVVTYDVTDRLTLNLMASYDHVSSASIDRLGNYAQQSGASADNYVGGTLGFKYKLSDDLRVGGSGSFSTEYDYTSFGLSGDVEWDLFQKNTTLKLGVSFFLDQIDLIRFDGSEDEGSDDRLSITVNLGWYQILSPTVHMSLGYTLAHQTGFLSTNINGVVLEDPNNPLGDDQDPDRFIDLNNLPAGVSIVAEQMPDTRLRNALYGEIRKYFDTGTALSLGARFYVDTWGIVSETLELKLYQWIVKDVFRVRVRYRFYNQSAADDYDEHFRVPLSQRTSDPYKPLQDRTQDADLGAFSGHTIGLKLTWNITKNLALDVSGDYVLRSDGINQILGAVGLKWDF